MSGDTTNKGIGKGIAYFYIPNKWTGVRISLERDVYGTETVNHLLYKNPKDLEKLIPKEDLHRKIIHFHNSIEDIPNHYLDDANTPQGQNRVRSSEYDWVNRFFGFSNYYN